jgi:nucleoside-diphosphate-sugar epimerase
MKQYLVTGGAGFIGSHIVRALLDQNAAVRVLDNFSSGRHQNFDDLINAKNSGRLEIHEGDIRDADKVAEVVQGVNVVFHEAAFVSVPESMEKPQECFDINITGTTVLFEAARKAGVRRAVIASSSAVYGDSKVMPLTERSPLSPMSPYAVSKRVSEMLGALYTQAFDFEVVALRYFNVYGPRQRPDSMYAAAIPIFMRRMIENNPITVFGDGGQTRDFVFIDDVVRANLIAAAHPEASGQTFNVCSGLELSLLDLLDVLHELFPDAPSHVFDEPRAGDIYKSLGSAELAEHVIGFKAQTDLASGLKKTADWMGSFHK